MLMLMCSAGLVTFTNKRGRSCVWASCVGRFRTSTACALQPTCMKLEPLAPWMCTTTFHICWLHGCATNPPSLIGMWLSKNQEVIRVCSGYMIS